MTVDCSLPLNIYGILLQLGSNARGAQRAISAQTKSVPVRGQSDLTRMGEIEEREREREREGDIEERSHARIRGASIMGECAFGEGGSLQAAESLPTGRAFRDAAAGGTWAWTAPRDRGASRRAPLAASSAEGGEASPPRR